MGWWQNYRGGAAANNNNDGGIMGKRPDVLAGSTSRYRSKCGWLYATPNVNERGELVELILKLGKQGSCARAWLQTSGELITDFLGTSKIDRIWKHFYGIDCVANAEGLSCQQIIANVLESFCDKDFVKEVKERVAKQRENETKVIEE